MKLITSFYTLKKKGKRKAEEHITFACLMSEQVRKCTSKTNPLKPLSKFLGPFLFDHLDNLPL